MSIKEMLEVVPPSARPALKVLVAVITIAIGALYVEHKADAHIEKKILPVKVKVYRQDAVIDHVWEDLEDDRVRRGLPRHDLDKIKEKALQKMKEEDAAEETDE